MSRYHLRRELWPGTEVGILLLLIIPSFFVGVDPGDRARFGFVDVAVTAMVRDLGLLALVLYWLWRGNEPLRVVGLEARGFQREIAVGIGLFIPFLLSVGAIRVGLEALGLPAEEAVPDFLVPRGIGETALALVFLVVVAVTEETLFRGYLIHRFRQITGSTAAAVVVSSFLFSLGHGYQGATGLVTVGLLGLILAGIYLWRGSLVAPMVLHFMQNFTGILLAPALLGTNG